MPTEIARWYDVMDELGNQDYAFMNSQELHDNQSMYYEIAKQEFPHLFE